MAKQIIRLTEGELMRLIETSVRRIIRESDDDYGWIDDYQAGKAAKKKSQMDAAWAEDERNRPEHINANDAHDMLKWRADDEEYSETNRNTYLSGDPFLKHTRGTLAGSVDNMKRQNTVRSGVTDREPWESDVDYVPFHSKYSRNTHMMDKDYRDYVDSAGIPYLPKY